MTIRQQLWQEIESSSDEILSETLNFLQALKNKSSQTTTTSTGKSLLQHLENLPNWSGNDLKKSLRSVKETRTQAKFDLCNPFDEMQMYLLDTNHCSRAILGDRKILESLKDREQDLILVTDVTH